ncbi:MAG: bifunctional riboflavin kinase/FAD synthetase [Actinobacteria bacterium]|nr:bifunctional riboflavin kinase/FAD synthetase [Actinomycetota bacterium]
MEVIRADQACRGAEEGVAVTIGFFDGVHLGHQALIGAARRRGAELGVPTAVVTFDRHPATVVRPASAPLLLTDLDQRLERLADLGVDLTLVLAFDEARAQEEAEEFVGEVLAERLSARAVVVGADFHFGHRRGGNVELLRSLGRRHGFTVHGLELAGLGATPVAVSSTAIRRALAEGDLAGANAMLGRDHEVRGVVEGNDRRGATLLGYPTANVAVPPEIQLPAPGIYAGWYVRPDGAALPAAISLGWRPTFARSSDRPLLEAHVLDFDGDLYGEAAAIRFSARLRDEERFESVEALVAQMDRDVAASRALLVPASG